MGTRNLTMVIDPKGVTKVAQYGQWDGYPSGVGSTILDFLKAVVLVEFIQKLESVQCDTQEQRNEFLKSIGLVEGKPATKKQEELYNERYFFDNRDIAGDILTNIMECQDEQIVLVNSEDFASDSVFCEWAYVIDLQKMTFEVYEGFNKSPLDEGERFFHLQEEAIKENSSRKDSGLSSEYFPVRLVKEYNLTELPEKEEFVKECEPKDEEEE